MKILHIHDFFALGNSRLGHDICRYLVKRGHEVSVLAGVGESGPKEGDIIDGVKFHTYSYGFGMGSISFFRHAVKSNKAIFDRIGKEENFELLLFNQPLCFYGVAKSKLSNEVPKVYSFISPWGVEWAIAHSNSVGIYKKINVGLRNILEGKALRGADRVITISDFMKQQLLGNHPDISKDKLEIITPGVDINRFSPDGVSRESKSIFGISQGHRVISTVRRLVPRMGVENLINAMPTVWQDFPQTTLVIGGDGPLKESLRTLAKKYSDKIKFLGYVTDVQMPALFRASDLVVLPTKELEGFGMVLIEAMACGTPAMGTPVGAIPEVLKPLDSRLLFDGNSTEEIAKGIIRFFKLSDSVAELKKRCRQYAVEVYNWDKIISKIEATFNEVIKSRASSRY